MKIAIFIGYMGSGGAEIVASKCANVLSMNSKHELYFIYLPTDKNYYLDEISKDVNITPLKSNSLLRCIGELRKLLKKLKIETVISHMTDENIITSIAITGLKINHIGYEHNHLLEIKNKGKFRWLVTSFLMKCQYRKLKKLIVVSDGLRAHFEPFLNIENIIRIYNPCVSNKYSKRSEWFQYNKCLNIAFVGRNAVQKNFPHALKILNILLAEFPNIEIKLNVYGSGFENHHSSSVVQYHGHKKRNIIYKENDVLLMTSNYEGFGNVVIEAVQAGCFPIVKKVDFGPEEIIKKTYGYLFEKDDEIIEIINNGWAIEALEITQFGMERFAEELEHVVNL